MPHFMPSADSRDERCFDVERGLDWEGTEQQWGEAGQEYKCPGSRSLHLDIMISEPLEWCEPVVFVFFYIIPSSYKGKIVYQLSDT